MELDHKQEISIVLFLMLVGLAIAGYYAYVLSKLLDYEELE